MATNPQVPVIDPQAITAAHAALASAPALPDAPGVDKIRELLFGNQMQDYDRRFSVLEERFQQRLRDVEGGVVTRSWQPGVLDQEAAGIDRRPGPPGAGTARRGGQGIGAGACGSSFRDLRSALARSPTGSPASSGNSPSGSGTSLRPCVTRCGGETRILAPPSSGCSPSSATSRPTAICSPVCSSRLPAA